MVGSNDRASKPWYLKYWPALVAGGVVLVIAISLFAINNGVKNKGNKMEQGLNAQYSNSINFLSDCVVRIRETAGVATGEAEALNEILADAVSGRYDSDSSAQVGGGQLFSAIVEAYPDLSGLSETFDQVLVVVNGCRTDFRDQQTRMQDMIRDYESWRTGSWTVRTFGGEFPSGNLRAVKGDEILHGDEALEQMRRVVVVSEANEAFETGELEAEDPFGTSNSQE